MRVGSFRWRLFGYLARTLHTRVHYLRRELTDCDSVLDLGCGASSPVQYCTARHTVGVDVCTDYLRESRRRGTHRSYVRADLRRAEFPPRSFDAVVLADVIEHLSKAEGRELLERAERWARQKVVVLTPNGYMPLEEENGQEPCDAHLCGWEIEELRALGYDVYGLQGLRRFRRAAQAPGPARWLWKVIVYGLLQPFAFHRPAAAHDLLAVKRVREAGAEPAPLAPVAAATAERERSFR